MISDLDIPGNTETVAVFWIEMDHLELMLFARDSSYNFSSLIHAKIAVQGRNTECKLVVVVILILSDEVVFCIVGVDITSSLATDHTSKDHYPFVINGR